MRGSSSSNVALRWMLIASVCAIALSACSDRPEIDRPGTWHPTGANEQNLRAMVANPRDLYAGERATTSRGDSAARAVTRLLTDRRRQLLNVTVSRVAPTQDVSDTPLGAGAGSGRGAP